MPARKHKHNWKSLGRYYSIGREGWMSWWLGRQCLICRCRRWKEVPHGS